VGAAMAPLLEGRLATVAGRATAQGQALAMAPQSTVSNPLTTRVLP